MVNDRATLLITEFGYMIEDGIASFEYVATAPIHALPIETYRIENLGTGQLRLNASVKESLGGVAWERSCAEFFDGFSRLCIAHYERVKVRADERIKAIETFIDSGYSRLTLK